MVSVLSPSLDLLLSKNISKTSTVSTTVDYAPTPSTNLCQNLSNTSSLLTSRITVRTALRILIQQLLCKSTLRKATSRTNVVIASKDLLCLMICRNMLVSVIQASAFSVVFVAETLSQYLLSNSTFYLIEHPTKFSSVPNVIKLSVENVTYAHI